MYNLKEHSRYKFVSVSFVVTVCAEEEDILEDDFEIPALGDPVINLLRAGAVEEHVPVETTVDLPVIGQCGVGKLLPSSDLYSEVACDFVAVKNCTMQVSDVSGESVVASYEDLVRQYVDGFLASAQQYAKITELSRRVSEWEDKIFPKLRQEVRREILVSQEERARASDCGENVKFFITRASRILTRVKLVAVAFQELNGPFDIHKYGTKILHSFVTTRRKRKAVEADSQETTDADVSSTDLENAAGKVIPFRSVCSGRPAFDVSRLFLASLQLVSSRYLDASVSVGNRMIETSHHSEVLSTLQANTYNIEIGSEGVLESGMDTMTVKLLSTKRHFEELEEYRAPSLQT